MVQWISFYGVGFWPSFSPLIIPSKFYYRDILAPQQLEKCERTTTQVIVLFLVLQRRDFLLTIEEAGRLRLVNIEETSLERMEALLSQSALGVHVLFDNKDIAGVLKEVKDDKDFYSFDKMKKVQDVMTELIAKKTYFEKMAYLQALDPEAYQMLVRAYFHIVENTVRANSEFH
jgi:hypothetical protein